MTFAPVRRSWRDSLTLLALGAATIVLGSCGSSTRVATDGAGSTAPSEASTVSSDAPDTAPVHAAAGVPQCADLSPLAAPADRYGTLPAGVDEGARVEQIRAWAADDPDYVDLWIDRADHNGWLTVAFTDDTAERQRELDELFPDGGVVAVTVDHTMAELEDVQRRATEVLPAMEWGMSTGISLDRGVVSLGIGALTEDRLALVAEHFAGDPVCVEGADPSTIVPEGPQLSSGDGWQLLADQTGTQPYQLGIATTPEQYGQLWSTAGLTDAAPPVDFEKNIVVWFGAVYSGSCPDLRFDGFVADDEHDSVYPVLVQPGPQPMGCTADANGRAYVVAIDRGHLPPSPFTIRLQPPDARFAGVEPIEVADDLRSPGSVHEP